MKNKLISLTIIILLSSAIFLAATSITSAQSVVAGVSKGETFEYSYSLLWTSTDSSPTPPSDLVEYNNTQKIQFKITNVEGSDISVDFIRIFNNGTQTVESGSIDIESGTVSVPYGFLIIGANLNKNQQVYPTGGHQVITDTVTRSFAGVQREINVISSEDSTEKTTIDFDRAKGVALDYLFEIRETSGNDNIVSTETLTNTNSNDWGVASSTLPLPLIAIVIVIVAIVIVVVAITVFRKKQKPNTST